MCHRLNISYHYCHWHNNHLEKHWIISLLHLYFCRVYFTEKLRILSLIIPQIDKVTGVFTRNGTMNIFQKRQSKYYACFSLLEHTAIIELFITSNITSVTITISRKWSYFIFKMFHIIIIISNARYHNVFESQNHKMFWFGKDFKDHPFPIPYHERKTFN